MKKIVLATQEILNGQRRMDNVVYRKSGEELYITFSHNQLTDHRDFKPTTWEKVSSLFPSIKDIRFDRDTDTMLYDGNAWNSTDAD